MSAVGRDGLHAHPAMELSTPSRRNDRQIRITDSRAQRGLDSYRIDGDIVQSCHTCGLEITERKIFFYSGTFPTTFIRTETFCDSLWMRRRIKSFRNFPESPIWQLLTSCGCAYTRNLVLWLAFVRLFRNVTNGFAVRWAVHRRQTGRSQVCWPNVV